MRVEWWPKLEAGLMVVFVSPAPDAQFVEVIFQGTRHGYLNWRIENEHAADTTTVALSTELWRDMFPDVPTIQ